MFLSSRNGIVLAAAAASRACMLMQERAMHPIIKKKLKNKQTSIHLALEYFDFFYGASFGDEWHQARLAMLAKQHKYAALVNNYADWPSTLAQLESLTALNMLEFSLRHNRQQQEQQQQQKQRNRKQDQQSDGEEEKEGGGGGEEKPIEVPMSLKVFTFDNGVTSQFPSPKRTFNGLLDYYCMDGASILPVIAMDIERDDLILDLCASPGGKTLAMLQTLLPSKSRQIICVSL